MFEKRKVPQGIKRLIPLDLLPLNLNAFRLSPLLCRLIGYSDEVLSLPAEYSLDMGNVECLED